MNRQAIANYIDNKIINIAKELNLSQEYYASPISTVAENLMYYAETGGDPECESELTNLMILLEKRNSCLLHWLGKDWLLLGMGGGGTVFVNKALGSVFKLTDDAEQEVWAMSQLNGIQAPQLKLSGKYFLISEYVKGDDRFNAEHNNSLVRAFSLGRTLAQVHNKGIAHKDLGSNYIFASVKIPVFIDFGRCSTLTETSRQKDYQTLRRSCTFTFPFSCGRTEQIAPTQESLQAAYDSGYYTTLEKKVFN